MVTAESTPKTLLAPPDFPVTWEHPDDANEFWQVERMHWPDPITPLDFEYMRDSHLQFNWSLIEFGVPLKYTPRHINYRWYYTVVPTVSDLSEMPTRMQAGIQQLEATIAQLKSLWNDEWLPEVQEHLAFWDAFDLTNATMPELLAHLNETNDRHNRVWQIHFLQTLPVYMAMSTFDDLYQDLFGTDNGLVAYRLMQGLDNKTIEMGRALWGLSRQVLRSQLLTEALAESNASQVIAALEQSDEGRAFLADFDAFLDTFGRRGEKLGVGFVTWIEDPSQAIRQLQEYVSQPNLDFDNEMSALATERERLIGEARVALSSYPQPLIDKFEAMLDYAQQATIISEDHNYYIDFGAIYQVRQVLIEFGRRFTAAGVLNDPQDVFMLTSKELRDTAEFLPHLKRQSIVAARTAEMEHFHLIAPPAALGTLPAGPPPDDTLSRTIGKFFGAPAPEPKQTDGALVIRGGSGSSGLVKGVARVIESLSDAGKLTKGDILVAPTTAPTWTPLFATAGAVVTDTGGVLSHSAVVAREYRIPAVVGTGIATTVIHDGDLVEVNGDDGVVRIINNHDSTLPG